MKDGRILCISGTSLENYEFLRMSRNFQAQFCIPETFDVENISAELNDGTLCVTFPKKIPVTKKVQVKKAGPKESNSSVIEEQN